MSIFNGIILAGYFKKDGMEKNLSGGDLIPSNEKGHQSATTHTIKTENHKAARALYEAAQQRLLDVNSWKEISGDLSASFVLNDSRGTIVRRPAMEGDYIRIRIPGSTADETREFDWVRIEKIIERRSPRGTAYTGMRVRPATPPDDVDREIEHFFRRDATSSFIVEKRGNLIRASVYGRNEMPNTLTGRALRKLRNLLAGLGAMLGISRLQWKSLVKGLLRVRRNRELL